MATPIPSIEMLNEDCLLLIFDLLPLSDRISCEAGMMIGKPKA